jgi:hypothetical protein
MYYSDNANWFTAIIIYTKPEGGHMKKPFIQLIFILFFLSLTFACASNTTKSENYTPDQQEIIGFLDELQQKYNSKDQEGFLALWHEKAKIMYSPERIVVSKKEFVEILPKRMEISPVMKLKIHDIKVTGNSAIAKTSGRPHPKALIKPEMKMVRENGRWYLMSWDY